MTFSGRAANPAAIESWLRSMQSRYTHRGVWQVELERRLTRSGLLELISNKVLTRRPIKTQRRALYDVDLEQLALWSLHQRMLVQIDLDAR